MSLVLFLLCSGFFHFTFANRLRIFSFKTNNTMSEAALNICKVTNESFVTLYDEDDARFTAKFTNRKAWLGLRRGRGPNTFWSDGSPLKFNETSLNGKDGDQICGAIDNTTWIGYNCSERKPFMCYKGNNYTLIENKRNWCQALQYCRKYFTDLVSIRNRTQNEEVIEKGKNTDFWIGLLHDEWEWENKSCSSFRKWSTESPSDEDNCTAHILLPEINQRLLYRYKCSSTAHPFCSKGTVRIKVIEQNLTWEQAFDYCKANHTGLLWIEDEMDQTAVEQWLNNTEVGGPFWIGLRQSHVFGFWIWTSDRIVSYTNWKDAKQPELYLSNHCGVITSEDYTWKDENCWLQLPFLCEEEIIFMNK